MPLLSTVKVWLVLPGLNPITLNLTHLISVLVCHAASLSFITCSNHDPLLLYILLAVCAHSTSSHTSTHMEVSAALVSSLNNFSLTRYRYSVLHNCIS